MNAEPRSGPPDALRDHLARLLGWSDAHVRFDDAVQGLAPALRGVRPPGLPHSAWELLEHLRIAQRDLLEFCTADEYHERSWPDQYWPAESAPPSADAWQRSVHAFGEDRAALQRLVRDPAVDLAAPVPHGDRTQTVLREVLLAADHAAYHVGQLVLVRRALDAWPPDG